MSEFIFLTASDIHISDNGPSGRIDDFKATILNKLSQLGMACNKLNADGAIIAGDLFNLKNPAKNSHQLNQDLIKVFKQFNCPVYMIEGNHDLSANSLESLEEQPLGVLFADGTLIQLRHTIIEKNGLKVSLVGVPYTEGLDLDSLKLPEKGDAITQICVMHIYATLKEGKLFKERLYGYDEIAKLPADIFVLGHYHIDQGIYEESGKHFINIGSLSRGTLSQEDINHHPQIGLIKIELKDNKPFYTFKSIRLRIKPANEVFNLEKKEEHRKEVEEIEVFVEKLAEEAAKNATKDTTKTIDDILVSMDLAKIIKDKVMYFIQEAGLKK